MFGHPQTAYHSLSAGGFLSSDSATQRLSFPLNAGAPRPRRVLEDASHHFRPFVPRDPDHRSPFESAPHCHSDVSLEPDRAFSIRGIQDSSPTFPYQLSARNPLAQLEPPQHLASAQLISNRNSTQRAEELRHGKQLFAPPPLHHGKAYNWTRWLTYG